MVCEHKSYGETAWLPLVSLAVVERHPIEKMTKEELIRILRIPSPLGRDVINRFRLIFDKEKEELTVG
jgi:hypothetical protein